MLERKQCQASERPAAGAAVLRLVDEVGGGMNGYPPGSSPSVTVTAAVVPSWCVICTFVVLLGRRPARMAPRSSEVSVGLPATAVMRSPTAMPAFAAGPFAVTEAT